MKGITFMIVFAFLALGLIGLFYVVLDRVYDTQIDTWGQDNIIDGNQTSYQTIFRTIWNSAVIVIPVFAFILFLAYWAQTRRIEEI